MTIRPKTLKYRIYGISKSEKHLLLELERYGKTEHSIVNPKVQPKETKHKTVKY